MRQINIPDGNAAVTVFTLPNTIKFRQIADNLPTASSQDTVLGNALVSGAIQGLNIVLIERMEKVNSADVSGWRIWYLP